jgi:hypothetical protein
MSAPLRMSFDVACSVEHAFTVTGQAGLVIVMQSGVGGRIYERASDGAEYDWGEVTTWKPPTRLAYLWHLGQDRAGATEVEIRFLARGAAATRIEIEHRGWERLGNVGEQWRDRNRAGWQTLLPHFLAAVAKGDS